jgi:CRP-like cAMP-binding protein
VNVKGGFFSFSKKVAELGPGSIVGEMSLLTREPRTATVVCEEPAKVFVLLADHFDEALRQNPAFAEQIKKLAADRKFELSHK